LKKSTECEEPEDA